MSLRNCFVGVLLLSAGCGRSPSDSAGEAAVSPPAPPAVAVPSNEGSSTAVPEAVPMDAILGELTQAVRKFSVERRAVPKGLEELVAHGYLSQLPQAPDGKRFVIARDLRVVLEE
ncbi:MAG: hypothetical protein ACKVYV_10840 [Limisphaerales bacterium]